MKLPKHLFHFLLCCLVAIMSHAEGENECKREPTWITPCPFINALIRAGEIGSKTTTVGELVEVAAKYGVDRTVMTLFAKGRAELGTSTITLAKLLDRSSFPAHSGSLARSDEDLSIVDEERLNDLISNKNFSTNGRISFEQLQKYQDSCWQKSNMALLRDKLPAAVELRLMWDLFGAYRDDNKTIPLNLVYIFLKDNSLPEDFQANRDDPSTVFGLLLSLIHQTFSRV